MTACIPANRGFRWNTRSIHSRGGLRLVIHNPMEGLESKFKPDTPELRDLNSAFFYESLITCQIIHTQLSAVTKCIKNITIFLRTMRLLRKLFAAMLC